MPTGPIMETVKQSQQNAPKPKETFKDPLQMQAEAIGQRKTPPRLDPAKQGGFNEEQAIEKANAALSGKHLEADLKDFDEMEKISDEDLELAEQTIFKGYAEMTLKMPNMPAHNFTICTTSAEDISVIDEIIYDMVKAKENKEGDVDLPAQHVQTMRAALGLALCFKGADGKDFCDEPVNQLMTIKRAVIRVKDLDYEGKMDESKGLMDSLKKSVKYRATRLRRYPTPLIDYLSQKKFDFDTRMYTIMMSNKIIPKSSGQSQVTQGPTSSSTEEASSTGQ